MVSLGSTELLRAAFGPRFGNVDMDSSTADGGSSNRGRTTARSTVVVKGLQLLIKTVCLTVVISPWAVALYSNHVACDRSADVRAPRLVEDLVDPLPEGAMLFTREWQFYSPWWALHHLQQFRSVRLLSTA